MLAVTLDGVAQPPVSVSGDDLYRVIENGPTGQHTLVLTPATHRLPGVLLHLRLRHRLVTAPAFSSPSETPVARGACMVTDYIALFGAGVASFLAPCLVPLVPAYLGMIVGESGDSGDIAARRAGHDRLHRRVRGSVRRARRGGGLDRLVAELRAGRAATHRWRDRHRARTDPARCRARSVRARAPSRHPAAERRRVGAPAGARRRLRRRMEPVRRSVARGRAGGRRARRRIRFAAACSCSPMRRASACRSCSRRSGSQHHPASRLACGASARRSSGSAARCSSFSACCW